MMYVYLRIDTWDRNSYFGQKRKQRPSPEDDASTAEATAGSQETSKVRHDEQTAHRTMDLISS